jgi:hypothetical protein
VNADPSSPYRVVVRNSVGNVLSTTPMAMAPVHGEPNGSHVVLISGEVPIQPSSGASKRAQAAAVPASVTLTALGKEVATRIRSPHSPRAAFVDLPGNISGRGMLNVRWRESDADGDRMLATLEYSINNGKTYRVLTSLFPGTTFRTSAVGLGRAQHARLRLSVNDGFNTTTIVSKPFRTSGSAPVVTVLSPVQHERGFADASLYGSAQAYDDEGKYLTGRALRWFDGRRLLGHGNHVNIAGLTVGRHRIVVMALDRFGRTGRRSVEVTVLPVKPQLVGLRVPSKLKPTARRLVLRTAATVAGMLVHGNDRCRVGTRARRCSFKVKPGRATLHLTLTLTFGPRSTKVAIAVPR